MSSLFAGRSRRRYVTAVGVAASLAMLTAGTALAIGGGGQPAAAESQSTLQKGGLTGLPGRGVDGVEGAGAVELRTVDGTKRLLTAPDPRPNSRFGAAVHESSTGVWDDDTGVDYKHLVLIGAPGLSVDGKPDAGGVYVFERDEGRTQYVDLLTQDHPGIPGEAQAGAEFGTSVDSTLVENDDAPGDFETVVHVGTPGLDVGEAAAAGGVVELEIIPEGSNGGYRFGDGTLHTLASVDVGVEPSAGDRLGATVHADDWGGFFSGAPTATVAGKPNAGFVLGYQVGRHGNAMLYPGSTGLPGQPQRNERFGAALDQTVERLPASEGSFRDLLVIGAPGRTVHGEVDAGKVYVLRSDDATSNHWRFHRGFSQDSPGNGAGTPVGGTAEEGDEFGTAVQYAISYSKHERPFLLVGVPGEDLDGNRDAGLVNGLYGAPGVHEGMVAGTPAEGHAFGSALSTNVVGDRVAEYLIGVPGLNDGAGGVAYGHDKDGVVSWPAVWTLFNGDGQPGDGYGSAFDQGGR